MATYRLTGPDGSTYNVTAPDGVSQDDVLKTFHANLPASPASPAPPKSAMDAFLGEEGGKTGLRNFVGKNALMGAVSGAADVGATLQHALNPFEWGDNQANQDRRAGINGGAQALGADTSSVGFHLGRLGGQTAGTAGAGGALSKMVGPAVTAVAPQIGPLVTNALASGGFRLGPPALGAVGDTAVRMGAGAINGAAQTGLVNPDNAGVGATIGGLLPPLVRGAGAAGAASADLLQKKAGEWMQSALKPTREALTSGDAAIAIREMLDRGINPTVAGVNKLRGLISDLNDKVSNAIQGSTASVDPNKVVNALSRSTGKFSNQVAPTADLAAIDNIKNDFLNTSGAGAIPVQLAQKVKQGTYNAIGGKFGEMGSASTEAQKDLARGLKDEIATAVPGVGALNAEESRLISTLDVAERAALSAANKNPAGLSLLTSNPAKWAAFMADRSPLFKTLIARTLNASSDPASRAAAQGLLERASNPALRASLALSDQGSQR